MSGRHSTTQLGRFGLAVALLVSCMHWAIAATIPAGGLLSPKQEFVRNNGAEPETLDPALASTVPAANIIRDMFEGLTAVDNVGAVVPGVAQTWQQTNPTTWVFNLRSTAKWSNGEAVTADDFVYGIRRFLDPETASTYAATYGVFIANGLDVVQGKKKPTDLGVKALNKTTLEITTPFPVSFLPDVVSNAPMGPVPRATIEKFGKAWTKPDNIVSNGAYVMSDWQVNSKIVLKKNPQYWDAKNVPLTKVTYLAVEDENADVKLFESGENDWVDHLPAGSYALYKSKFPREIRNAPQLGLRYYSLLNTDPLLKDVRVRKALSMVIDRNILADKITADGQVPSYGVIVRGVAGAQVTSYDWATWPMAKRVEEAKKLLAQAGVRPGTKIKFMYNTSDYHKKMAIFAAAEWKSKLGLDTEMEAMEFKVLIKKRDSGEYQIARNGWLADYNDATTFLTLVECNSEQNSQRNCNRNAQKLIEQGNASSQANQRSQLLTQAAKMIMDDYPMIPLLQYTVPRLVKSYVGGYTNTNALDRYRSKDLYIVKH